MKYSVSEKILSTGTKGLFIDVPNSEVVQVKIYFRGGFQFGDFAKFELPHVLEHMILSSSKGYPGNDQLRTEFTKNGAQHNAHTTSDLLVYWLQAADIDFERAFGVFALGLTEPILPKEMLTSEIGNVSSELTAKLSQTSFAPSLMSSAANYPSLYIPMQDRIDQLEAITITDVEEYFKRTHTARNGGFIVAGAVHRFSEQIVSKLEAIFTALPAGECLEFDQSPGTGQDAPLVRKESVKAEFFRLEWFAEGGEAREAAVFDIIATVLTRGWDSRIFGQIRKSGASYSTSSGFDHSPFATHYIIAGQANPDRLEEVEKIVANECARLLTEPVPQSEIDQAVLRIEGASKVATQTPATVANWYQDEYIFNQVIQSQDDYFALLRTVTPADIQAAARKVFLSERHSSAYAGPMEAETIEKIEGVLKPIWK